MVAFLSDKGKGITREVSVIHCGRPTIDLGYRSNVLQGKELRH